MKNRLPIAKGQMVETHGETLDAVISKMEDIGMHQTKNKNSIPCAAELGSYRVIYITHRCEIPCRSTKENQLFGSKLYLTPLKMSTPRRVSLVSRGVF